MTLRGWFSDCLQVFGIWCHLKGSRLAMPRPDTQHMHEGAAPCWCEPVRYYRGRSGDDDDWPVHGEDPR